MPTRRLFLGAAMVAGLIIPARTQAAAVDGGWSKWVRSYVNDGRVIDGHQNGITHSEGQGYGLLLAQAFGDRRVFKKLEESTDGVEMGSGSPHQRRRLAQCDGWRSASGLGAAARRT